MKTINQVFSVDSALLQELGERLVTTPHVALAELVKNSYDADATQVLVTIREGKNGGPEIEVTDNGRGMTLGEIRNYWMRIGHTNKASARRSERFGRPLSGSKGIGRFCVRRLGTRVQVESNARVGEEIEHTVLDIDWTQFVAGKDVGEVQVKGQTSRTRTGTPGLKLTMSGSRAIEWRPLEDKRSYNYLLRQLATLSASSETKRRGFEPDPGFRVRLNAPSLELGHTAASLLDNEDQKSFAVDIRERLMDAGWAQLTARIDGEGYIHCELDAALPVGRQLHKSNLRLNVLRHSTLRVAIFVEEPGWNRDEVLVPVGKLNEILSDWGGIHVRHKGMRVFPYGDPGDDWLNIERDRARRYGKAPGELFLFAETLKARSPAIDPGRVLLSALSAKAYLGGVQVSEREDNLEQKADRQGFVANEAFDELRRFARYTVDWAMIWRDFALRERDKRKVDRFRAELQQAKGGKIIQPAEQAQVALATIREGIKFIRDGSGSIPETHLSTMVSAAGLLEAEFRATRSDLLRFQLVASAATLSLLYHHEVRYLTANLNSLAAELKIAIDGLKGTLKLQCRAVLDALTCSIESLGSLSDLTQDMGILDRKAQAIELDLNTNIARAASRFQRVCETYRIEIVQHVDEGLLVGPMLKGELAAVLLNVISNAIKAVIAGSKSKRLIEFRGQRSGRKVVLEVSDNGIGMNAQEMKAVFAPLVSDPSSRLYDALEERVDANDRELLGQGSGLGLAIVRGILTNRGGSVDFVQPSGGWSTSLRIQFTAPR